MALEKNAPDVFSFAEVSAPSTPPTGRVYVYAKSDGKMYRKDDTGTEAELGGSGGGAPTDATYIVQTANGTLSNEQALSSLVTGFMKSANGTGVVSTQAQIALASDVSGTLPIANGGTGQTTQTAAYDALSPNTTKGDIAVHNGTDNVRLPVGTNDYSLFADSTAAAGVAWKLRNAYAILRDEKTSGTNGGTSATTTWNNRNLNTETYDPFGIVSIASNQFTPIAGDYILFAWAATGATATNLTRLRLYNVTGAASVEEGLNTAGVGSNRHISTLMTKFTANGTDAYRIDHYTSVGLATSGLGIAVSDGSAEVYLEIVLIKVG